MVDMEPSDLFGRHRVGIGAVVGSDRYLDFSWIWLLMLRCVQKPHDNEALIIPIGTSQHRSITTERHGINKCRAIVQI